MNAQRKKSRNEGKKNERKITKKKRFYEAEKK
jgi:hypothetical protein